MLAFVNEVAGGRRLLEAIRERVEAGADAVAVAAPQNQPIVGQIVDRDEVRDAALSRVEVTQQVLDAFGIESVGRGHGPRPVAGARRRGARLPALARCCSRRSMRPASGSPARTWSSGRRTNIEVPVTHIPVRVDDDAVRWDVVHTLVVGTQTIASPDLIAQPEGARRARSRTATRSSARARATSAASRSASASRAPSPSSTGPTSTPPASR